MSEQDDTLIYGLEGANYAAGYAEGEQERDRLQSELDRLREDVEPVLRAAERLAAEVDSFIVDSRPENEKSHAEAMWEASEAYHFAYGPFRQQHPKEESE